jgi:hypothetical protein
LNGRRLVCPYKSQTVHPIRETKLVSSHKLATNPTDNTNAPRSREQCKDKSRAVRLERIRFGGADVDVAAAAGDEGVDESRQARRPDPFGAGQQNYGPRRRSSISRSGIGSLRLRWGRGGGRARVLGRDRAPRGEHGLEVGDEGRG